MQKLIHAAKPFPILLTVGLAFCIVLQVTQAHPTESPAGWVAGLPPTVQDSILWVGDVEEGTLYDWTYDDFLYAGGGIFNTGDEDVFTDATAVVAHSGQFAAETTITEAYRAQNGSRAIRLMRWTDRPWDDGGEYYPAEAYYSVWFYFPETYNPNKYDPWDPGDGGWWNVFQFKSDDSNGESQPIWTLNIAHDDAESFMYFYLYSKENLPNAYDQATPIPIPVNQWVHLEVRYDQSASTDGSLTVWQDGQQILDVANVRTILAGAAVWGIGNYTDHIAGGPVEGSATIYLDDAVVSTMPLSLTQRLYLPILYK